jgi:predicted permease
MNVFTADLALVITRLALLLGLGWFLARQGWVAPASRQSLMRLVIWVFFPAMIFDRVCGNPLIHSGGTALLYLGVGFAMIVTGILVGRVVAQALALPGEVCRRTFAFASGTNNFGYLGIPITAALFDRDVVGVLLVHNVGVEAAVWTVGISVLSGKPGLAGLRNFLQPMPVALFLALGLNFTGLGAAAPAQFVQGCCHAVGECAIPVGTILTGVYLHETLRGFRFFAEPRVTLGIAAVRWLIMPAGLLLVAGTCIADPALRKVMLVQAAMPAGMFTFLIVEMFGGQVQVSLRYAVVTMVCCPLVTPLWLALGSRWLGVVG